MRADFALARGDEIHRHSNQPGNRSEDGCRSRLPEAEGDNLFCFCLVFFPPKLAN